VVSFQTIQATLARIEQAAQRSGRTGDEIRLIAVSKQKPLADIINAYEAGVRHFGENRSEELEKKAQALSHLTDLKWHFIGHLQSRQSKAVAQYAHYFHALDRLKIAQSLSAKLVEQQRRLSVFIQVNVSGEESKSGFACQNWQQDTSQLEALIEVVKAVHQLPQLDLLGLMTMAPFDVNEQNLRTIFKKIAALSRCLRDKLPEINASQLSMGMSGDFEIAIEEGATHVRIGSAIFGARAT